MALLRATLDGLTGSSAVNDCFAVSDHFTLVTDRGSPAVAGGSENPRSGGRPPVEA